MGRSIGASCAKTTATMTRWSIVSSLSTQLLLVSAQQTCGEAKSAYLKSTCCEDVSKPFYSRTSPITAANNLLAHLNYNHVIPEGSLSYNGQVNIPSTIVGSWQGEVISGAIETVALAAYGNTVWSWDSGVPDYYSTFSYVSNLVNGRYHFAVSMMAYAQTWMIHHLNEVLNVEFDTTNADYLNSLEHWAVVAIFDIQENTLVYYNMVSGVIGDFDKIALYQTFIVDKATESVATYKMKDGPFVKIA